MSDSVKYKVLIVDDDKELLNAYITGLEDRYELRTYDRSDIIPISDFEWADVLVADFNMPKRNGVEVMYEMLSAGVERPVIFVSGFVPDLLEELQSIQVIEVLAKPISLKDLNVYIDLYAEYQQKVTVMENSLVKGITNAKELNKKVLEFHDLKAEMLAELRKKSPLAND